MGIARHEKPGSTAQGEEHVETAGTEQVSGSTRTPQLTTKGFFGFASERNGKVSAKVERSLAIRLRTKGLRHADRVREVVSAQLVGVGWRRQARKHVVVFLPGSRARPPTKIITTRA